MPAVGTTLVSVGVVAVLPREASLCTGQRSLTILAFLHAPTLAAEASQRPRMRQQAPQSIPSLFRETWRYPDLRGVQQISAATAPTKNDPHDPA
jgi:hypothetical protein